MKKCLRCAKQATLHITEVKGGKAIPLHLCESCAQEYLSTVELGGISDSLSPPPQGFSGSEEDEESAGAASKTCPHCHISYKEFRAQGRLGCPHDYEVFHDELLPLLESIHGDTQHVGRCPPRVSSASRLNYELMRLRNQLRDAVDQEQYEEAARLRDRIHHLEVELSESHD